MSEPPRPTIELTVEVDGQPRRLRDPYARPLDSAPLVTPMPLGPAQLAGLTQLDGEVVPVLWAGQARTSSLAVVVTTTLGRCVLLCGRALPSSDADALDVEALVDVARHEVRG